MGMIPTWDSITATLAAFGRRLTDLESGTRLGNSAINQGAIIARDAAGVERARYGQLLDGSFGLAAENIVVIDPGTGQQIPLAQALFGIAIISRTTLLSVPAAATLDWNPVTATAYVSFSSPEPVELSSWALSKWGTRA